MKQSTFKRLGQLILTAALFMAVIGCSEYNPTGSDAVSADNSQISGVLGSFDNRDNNNDGKSAYSFVFTGEIASFDEEKRVIFFEGQNFIAFVEKDAQLVQLPDRFRSDFTFSSLKTLRKITVYGNQDKYGTAYINVIEYMKETNTVISSSNG